VTSYSTLVRMAGKAKTKAEREKLMKQANAIRRKNRSKKKPAKPEAAVFGINQGPSKAWGLERIDRGEPGHGELVGGNSTPEYFLEADRTLERLSKLKKGDKDAAGIMLRSLVMTGVSAGRQQERVQQTAARYETNRLWQNKIVCSFIAECNMVQHMESGLPAVMMVQGLQIARVLDALASAGWTEDHPPTTGVQRVTDSEGRAG
jgi:hypothetical protein